MTHLGPDEIVDLIEGGLDAGRAGHLDACEACRARAAEVREALAAANEVEAAEPSPLFWEHFPVRVRDAIAAGPAPRLRWAWLTSPAFVLAGACVVAALSVAVVVLRAPATPAPQEAVVAEATAQDDWLDAARDDDVWDLVVAVSASLGWPAWRSVRGRSIACCSR